MALTDLTIRQAKPQDKLYHLADGDSLFLGSSRNLGEVRIDSRIGR